jgi:hypothetical protein
MAEIKSDWRAVGIDVTAHYSVAEEDKPHVKRIIDVFFYDRNEHTHLCEATPSYFLRYLYTTIEYAEGVFFNEDLRERLDQEYAHCYTEDSYMHVSDVDRITELAAVYGEEATEEEVREYWQGNCPL